MCRIQFEDAEETENENVNTLVNNLPEPCGKHTIFSSPDLKIGKGVHWHYEDFDQKAISQKPTMSALKVPPNSACKLQGAVTPSKNMNSEDRMQFWLAKGPKTPIR